MTMPATSTTKKVADLETQMAEVLRRLEASEARLEAAEGLNEELEARLQASEARNEALAKRLEDAATQGKEAAVFNNQLEQRLEAAENAVATLQTTVNERRGNVAEQDDGAEESKGGEREKSSNGDCFNMTLDEALTGLAEEPVDVQRLAQWNKDIQAATASDSSSKTTTSQPKSKKKIISGSFREFMKFFDKTARCDWPVWLSRLISPDQSPRDILREEIEALKSPAKRNLLTNKRDVAPNMAGFSDDTRKKVEDGTIRTLVGAIRHEAGLELDEDEEFDDLHRFKDIESGGYLGKKWETNVSTLLTDLSRAKTLGLLHIKKKQVTDAVRHMVIKRLGENGQNSLPLRVMLNNQDWHTWPATLKRVQNAHKQLKKEQEAKIPGESVGAVRTGKNQQKSARRQQERPPPPRQEAKTAWNKQPPPSGTHTPRHSSYTFYGKCWGCGERGHQLRECPTHCSWCGQPNHDDHRHADGRCSRPRRAIRCYGCHKLGHRRADCTESQSGGGTRSGGGGQDKKLDELTDQVQKLFKLLASKQ